MKRSLCTTEGEIYYSDQVDQRMRRYKAKIGEKGKRNSSSIMDYMIFVQILGAVFTNISHRRLYL